MHALATSGKSESNVAHFDQWRTFASPKLKLLNHYIHTNNSTTLNYVTLYEYVIFRLSNFIYCGSRDTPQCLTHRLCAIFTIILLLCLSVYKYLIYWPQWPWGPGRVPTADSLMRLPVRIPPGAWLVVRCECSQVEVSARSWSFVQRSPTECGASLCVISKPQEWGSSAYVGLLHLRCLDMHIKWRMQWYLQ